MNDAVILTIEQAVATITLNRPAVHNAFDDAMIAQLNDHLARVTADPSLRALVLRAAGKSFSAGADLEWMRRMATYSMAQNVADAGGLATLMHRLDQLPIPTLALVQGSAFGGGVGLVACCDIAIAATSAKFCFSEVKLGLIPAVISPYAVAAIGARAARRYFLTAEIFDAATAHALGLVHQVIEAEALDLAAEAILASLAHGGPGAQAASKALIRTVAGRSIDHGLVTETQRLIAEQRASVEGREGITAFLERRAPSWRSA
jgi:methylglutaconyl-CoA hydratase